MSQHDEHAQRVQEVFAQQAAAFEDHRSNRALTHDAAWLFEGLRCDPQDVLLDVAAGTGHAARSLAGRVGFVVAVDVTEEMLAAGKASAEQDGLANVLFLRGDALALPFLPESFDVALTRFSTHHIERPDVQLSEMARCLRPGGRLAWADLVADEDPEVARALDRLERLRDPSHTRTVPISEVVAEMESLGLTGIEVQARPVAHPVEPWLRRAASTRAADAVRAELQAELAGGPATGLRPSQRDGEMWLTQVWACVRAVKPGG